MFRTNTSKTKKKTKNKTKTKKKKGKKARNVSKNLRVTRKKKLLLIGQSDCDQSEPCKSDLKKTFLETRRLYRKKFTVIGCKTVQVAGNGVTIHGFTLRNRALLWQ